MRVREVAIEAVGDDFAQLSGAWIDGARAAACLRDARRAWAFAAPDDAAVLAWIEASATAPGARVIGVRLPGEAIAPLLAPDVVCGLLAEVPDACKGCDRCAHCLGTKKEDDALYCRKEITDL